MSSNETKSIKKHSNAPWQVVDDCRLIDADGFQVCVVGCSKSFELPLIPSEKCDVSLISAAPELLAACEQALQLLECLGSDTKLTQRYLGLVINKARGR